MLLAKLGIKVIDFSKFKNQKTGPSEKTRASSLAPPNSPKVTTDSKGSDVPPKLLVFLK